MRTGVLDHSPIDDGALAGVSAEVGMANPLVPTEAERIAVPPRLATELIDTPFPAIVPTPEGPK